MVMDIFLKYIYEYVGENQKYVSWDFNCQLHKVRKTDIEHKFETIVEKIKDRFNIDVTIEYIDRTYEKTLRISRK